MPSLPTSVSNYLDGLIADLQQGNPLDLFSPAKTHAAGLNFLRAMDVATALELLQAALTTTTDLTVVSGTTTTVTDGASTFVAGQQVGNYILFGSATTTTALRGVTRRIIANTTTTLTLDSPLPAAADTGDVYDIVGGFLNEDIANIRAGKGLGEGTVPIYADSRLVNHALTKLIVQLGGSITNPLISTMTAASGTVSSVVINVAARGAKMRIDEFKGMSCTVAAKGTLRVISNTEDTIHLAGSLSSAAAASDSVTIRRPVASSDAEWNHVPFSGGHPDNVLFADLLSQAKARVVAYTLPT